jgi:electron transfer flavoprotein beta subunit
MKIVVCVKHVPDAEAKPGFSDADHTLDRAGVDGLLSEMDEYAIEAALQLAEAGDDVTVTALTMGPERASDAVRKALQMGVHDGVHIQDDALHGSDTIGTARVLAAAIAKLEPDMVLMGSISPDGDLGVLPAMLAENLGMPQATYAESLTLDGSMVRIERDTDSVTQIIECALPAVVSVTDHANEPRYPSFKGIMGAKKKTVLTWSLADLEIAVDAVGLDAAWTTVTGVTQRPPRQAGQVVTDEGDGGVRLAEFLAGHMSL